MYHKDLNVWKESIELVKLVYLTISEFPKTETYALADQMRRSVVSVSSNIAEGCGRETNKELYHFLNMAAGSLAEVETQVVIAHELGYVDDVTDVEDKITVVQKLLTGFRKHIREQIEQITNQSN